MRRARVRHFVYMEIIRGCQMETITSRENAKIKYACRLREEEKLRTADGLFFAEGPKLCLELARGCTLQTLYATEKALAHTPELEAFAGKTVLVTEPVAQKLSGTKTSQDVFGVFEHPGWQAADILAKGRRILALEAVQDPGNVGTLLRSAAAFGFDGVLHRLKTAIETTMPAKIARMLWRMAMRARQPMTAKPAMRTMLTTMATLLKMPTMPTRTVRMTPTRMPRRLKTATITTRMMLPKTMPTPTNTSCAIASPSIAKP